jgi:hypothetical protein
VQRKGEEEVKTKVILPAIYRRNGHVALSNRLNLNTIHVRITDNPHNTLFSSFAFVLWSVSRASNHTSNEAATMKNTIFRGIVHQGGIEPPVGREIESCAFS